MMTWDKSKIKKALEAKGIIHSVFDNSIQFSFDGDSDTYEVFRPNSSGPSKVKENGKLILYSFGSFSTMISGRWSMTNDQVVEFIER